MNTQKELSQPQGHLLLPKAHVHMFAQVSLVVLGLLFFVGGLALYFFGYAELGGGAIEQTDSVEGAIEVFYFLTAGIAMGSGIAMLVGWSLWKYVEKFRVRFGISIGVASFAIFAGLVSVVTQDISSPIHYTFYFFALSVGMLVGLLSIFYFFQGVSKHLFSTFQK